MVLRLKYADYFDKQTACHLRFSVKSSIQQTPKQNQKERETRESEIDRNS